MCSTIRSHSYPTSNRNDNHIMFLGQLHQLHNVAMATYKKMDLTCQLLMTYVSPNVPVNSLAPGRCGNNLKLDIFKLIPRTDILCMASETALSWKPQDLIDDWSALAEVMAWCHQATSHYPSQKLTQFYVSIWRHYMVPQHLYDKKISFVFLPEFHDFSRMLGSQTDIVYWTWKGTYKSWISSEDDDVLT